MNSPIYVMWLRQLKRYWRSKSRMIGFLGQPILFLVALGFGLGPIYEKAVGGNYIQFIAPGILAMTILFSAMFNGMEIIWDRQLGFLKETLVAPVPRYKIMIGRTLGGATVALLQALVLLVITLIIGFRPISFIGFIGAIIFMMLISLVFTAVGISIASRLEDMQAFPLIINFIVMPLFFLSGALFPLDTAPKAIQVIGTINPLTYGVDLLRGSLIGLNQYSMVLDLNVIVLCLIIASAIGTYLFSKIEV